MTSSHPTWTGRTIGGRYKIESLLGRGGMSSVYRAADPNLRRVVAVKIIHPHLSSDKEFVRRFESEASVVAQLRHPGILQVYDFSHEGDTYFIVFEFIPGESLEERLRRLNEQGRKMTIQEVLQYAQGIAAALQYAHEREIVHRDVKPANVMLNVQGEAILMDFGIVKIIGGTQHTATGALVGTARYMSPEQIKGQKVDARTDIYAFGVMMYEMLSGKLPFNAESAMTLMMMHVNDPVPDIQNLRPEVPPALVAIVDRALAKDPERRYQTMAELLADLQAVAGGRRTGVAAPPPPPPRPADVDLTMLDDDEPAPTSARPSPPPPRSGGTRARPPAGQPRTEMLGATGAAPPRQAQPRRQPPAGPTAAPLPVAAAAADDGGIKKYWPLLLIGAIFLVVVVALGGYLLFMTGGNGGGEEPPAVADVDDEEEATAVPDEEEDPGSSSEPTTEPTATATNTPEPTATATATPEPTATPTATPIPVPDGMILIPGGTFMMGSTAGQANEQPEHTVTLSGYFIDQFEVSNADYAQCVAAGACTVGFSTSYRVPGYRDSPDYLNYPVMGVTWGQADAYCRWAGKQLPSEAEWEFAASGPDNLIWPWGNSFDPNLSAASARDTVPVDSYPAGVSPFGVYNMAGNVNEWVRDGYSADFYANSPAEDPVNPADTGQRIYRGGSFENTDGEFYRTSRRYVQNANFTDVDVGFRCAADLPRGDGN